MQRKWLWNFDLCSLLLATRKYQKIISRKCISKIRNYFTKNIRIFRLFLSKTDFKTSILKCHNKYRRKHRSPEVLISLELTKKAEEIAFDILNIVDGVSSFGNNKNYNCLYNFIISKNPELPHHEDICKLWYSTSLYYDFDADEINPESG